MEISVIWDSWGGVSSGSLYDGGGRGRFDMIRCGVPSEHVRDGMSSRRDCTDRICCAAPDMIVSALHLMSRHNSYFVWILVLDRSLNLWINVMLYVRSFFQFRWQHSEKFIKCNKLKWWTIYSRSIECVSSCLYIFWL